METPITETTDTTNTPCCGLPPFEKRDLTWYISYFALYMFTFASYLFAGVVRVEDLLEGKVGAEFLLNGRFMIWVLRRLTGGDAVNYPISGMVAGLLLAAVILLLVKWLRIQDTVSRAVCGMVFFCTSQWVGVLFFQKLADGMALGILLCLLAAIVLSSRRRFSFCLSILCCTLGIGFYHTLGLVFGVAVLVTLLFSLRYSLPGFGFRYLLKAAGVTLVSCTLYFAISTAIKAGFPPEVMQQTAEYQSSIIGWGQWSSTREMFSMIGEHGFAAPLKCMFSACGKTYIVAMAAMVLFWWKAYVACGPRKTLSLVLLGIALLCLPYVTGLLLLSPVGVTERLLCAMPVAMLCSVALLLKEGIINSTLPRRVLTVLCALLFVKNAYRVSSTAKSESYSIQTATAELRDMNLMGRTAAVQTAAHDGRILLCGFLPGNYYEDPRVAAPRSSYWHSSCASPFLFCISQHHVRSFMVESYARAERLPRLAVATAEEEAAHAETLQAMPIWPADGSVKADGDVVLIKIWEPIPPEEP